MRGQVDPQSGLFSYFSVEERIPTDHPLRRVKAQADAVLATMSAEFDAMYASVGRPSIAPERLLKASLLIALYSVRSDRLFCEMLDYNMLFRWFLDMNLEERSFDHSSFSKNRARLIEHDIAKGFFAGAVKQAKAQGLLSDEHFTVDGTLIESWASFKSFKRKDGTPAEVRARRHWDGRLPRARSDPTPRTSPAPTPRRSSCERATASLPSSASGRTRSWRIAAACSSMCRSPIRRCSNPKPQPRCSIGGAKARREIRTLGGDKGYYNKAFVAWLRTRHIAPHIARIEGRSAPGLDGRTTRHQSYLVSQRKRKRIEEIFGWMKTVGGLKRSRFVGIAKTQLAAYMVGAAYNLLRMARLQPTTG